ncbi:MULTISPECIES: hypothetical protein [unclassified Streptomyces]|uniref:hypothetical protein n=1 Tax=unclassified Streptomyces TaxID=2593676 RepID=UPI001319EDE8|nr:MULTISPECIES: hypothetical protein [unclassified Streptomyces]MYX34383.1 hypothetical protein [Streptomyces sp. SID8377]
MSTDSSVPPEAPAGDDQKLITILVDHYAPDSRDLPKKKRLLLLGVLVGIAIVTLLTTLLVENYSNLLFSGPTVRREDEVQKKLDLEGEPFTAQVTEPVFDPTVTPFDFVFDHLLTPAQERRMQEFSAEEVDELWDYLFSIGGRMVEYPTSGVGTHSSGFNLHLQSDRQAPLTLTDLRARVLSCAPSKAIAVVRVPPQGGGGYIGVFFNLAEHKPVARISEPTEKYGKPFFRDNVINLGNGENSGNLRIESIVESESCDWEIELEYADSLGIHVKTLKNKNLPFRTEALPSNPRQYWTVYPSIGGGAKWINCIDKDETSRRKSRCE